MSEKELQIKEAIRLFQNLDDETKALVVNFVKDGVRSDDPLLIYSENNQRTL